ncbi:MAG: hypothetical protein KF819_33425 [Labilithrix sp.]|nr:hypothetical protein [Labilithrix sp.]
MLPSSIGRSRLSARMWAALAAGAGSAACAYAGLYPQFDGGSLRVVLALTSAPFAAAVVATSLSAASRGGAFARAIFLSVILGVASTILPAAILTYDGGSARGQFVGAAVLGVVFGAPTGAIYGIPLGTLAALTHRHVHAWTDEATDRAARIAGIWLAVLSVGAFFASNALAEKLAFEMTNSAIAVFATLSAIVVAVAVIVAASLRLRARARWIARVRSGLEPAFRIRPVDMRDRLHALPRLTAGPSSHVEQAVVEWLPDGLEPAASAYRMTANGTAVAIVGR